MLTALLSPARPATAVPRAFARVRQLSSAPGAGGGGSSKTRAVVGLASVGVAVATAAPVFMWLRDIVNRPVPVRGGCDAGGRWRR